MSSKSLLLLAQPGRTASLPWGSEEWKQLKKNEQQVSEFAYSTNDARSIFDAGRSCIPMRHSTEFRVVPTEALSQLRQVACNTLDVCVVAARP